jgi:S-adenosyl-L-methionine methyltransferase
LPGALVQVGAKAALAHCDIGTGVAADNHALAAFLGPTLAAMMTPGGIVVSDQKLTVPGWTAVPLPPGVEEGRYYVNRAG